MGKITWDSMEERLYDAGVDHVVLYTNSGDEYIDGIPWNGIMSIDPGKGFGDSKTLYSGGVPALVTVGVEGSKGTIKSLGYPTFQGRANSIPRHYEHFGFNGMAEGLRVNSPEHTPCGICYRTMSSSSIEAAKEEYLLHLLYGVVFTDISRTYTTLNTSATAPVEYTFDYVALGQTSDAYGFWYDEIILDSRKCDARVIEDIESILYGNAESDPRLPNLEEVMDYFTAYLPLPDGYEDYPYEGRFPRPDVYPQTIGE